jgi:hypothetical protein
LVLYLLVNTGDNCLARGSPLASSRDEEKITEVYTVYTMLYAVYGYTDSRFPEDYGWYNGSTVINVNFAATCRCGKSLVVVHALVLDVGHSKCLLEV